MTEKKEIKVKGIISGYTSLQEENVVTLKVKTDGLSKEDLSMLKELYQFGKGGLKPKAILRIIFDGTTYELLGAYKNAY